MTALRSLVLDANIIIRCVLGVRAARVISEFQEIGYFVTPDTCVMEAKEHLPAIVGRRPYMDLDSVFESLARLEQAINVVPFEFYCMHEASARQRITQDLEDWQVVATAMLFSCPIWTEDRDFFGSGIPTWTSDRVHLYFDGR